MSKNVNVEEIQAAITTLKRLCKSTDECCFCPMYLNCFDSPQTWSDLKQLKKNALEGSNDK